MTFTPAHTDETSSLGNYTTTITLRDGRTIQKTIVPTPGELRGVPVTRHGGACPGTQPEQATITKLSKRDAA